MYIWQLVTIWVVKISIRLLRLAGKHGTALPGLIAETMYPGLLGHLAGKIGLGTILVTGTNGKTTTSKMLKGLLEGRGRKVLANPSGSNFTRGILASIIDHTGWLGRLDYDWAVLEIDEGYCRLVSAQIKPRCVLVLNVMRDQLDRYGEIDTTAQLIGESLEPAAGAVLNRDDPPVAGLGNHLGADKKTTYFGVSSRLRDQLPADEELLGGPATKAGAPHQADVVLREFYPQEDNLAVFDVGAAEFKTNLDFGGVHNAQNAAAALAALKHLEGGVDGSDLDVLSSVKPAFGRGEVVDIHGVEAHLALIKNPSGFNQNIRAFALEPDVGSVLILINDRYADSRDVSWLWDVDLEPLKTRPLKFVTGGIRAYDMALRLQYEDIPVADTLNSIRLALKAAVDNTAEDRKLLILPTYTAMLEVRKLLSRTAELEKIWR